MKAAANRCARRSAGFRFRSLTLTLLLGSTALAQASDAGDSNSNEPEQADSIEVEADANPHPSGMTGRPDNVANSPTVPASTIDVTVLDPNSNAVAGARVGLIRQRHSVAQGDSETTSELTTDPSGKARFERVESGSDTRYRVVLVDNGTRYGSRVFAMDAKLGAKVVLHTYPVVRSWRETVIFGRTFMFLEPRDQVLSVEYVHEFQNIGRTVLAADAITLDLPQGWKAFATNPSDSDLGITSTETGVKLTGAMAPGRHSVAFTFQIPTANRDRLGLEINLWPHTAEAQVATLARPGLELDADGFPAATIREGSGRQRLLWTGRSYTKDRSAPSGVRVEVSGLPTLGPGRWVAVALAALLACASLFWNVFKRGRQDPSKLASSNASIQAQERIVDELVALEKAHRGGEIGTTAFSDTREILLSAFVRAAREPSGRI